MADHPVTFAFIQHARYRLCEDYLPKIRQCLDTLSEEDIWWRPNHSCNSVGNLILHLCGNMRQWIVHELGGEPDIRNRPQEFSERGPILKVELLGKLESTIQRVDEVLKQFDEESILEPRTVQGFDESCLTAIFHVVEHFAQHLGQITYIAKMRKDIDLKYFDL